MTQPRAVNIAYFSSFLAVCASLAVGCDKPFDCADTVTCSGDGEGGMGGDESGDGDTASGGTGDGDGDTASGGTGDGDGDQGTGGRSTGGSGGGEACTCDNSQSCVGGQCVDWICEPKERFCSGNTVLLCAADGLSSEEDEECRAGYYCNTTSAECEQGVCAPDEPACDDNSARWCNMAGTGYEPGGTPCDSDETCDAGVCEPHLCAPGEEFCDGQQVMVCADNGLSSSLVEVCESQACVESGGTAGCEGECEPNETQCSGNGVQTCSASGQWGTAQGCGGTEPFCFINACTDLPPSCHGLAESCGAFGDENCCTSLPVIGGTFYRGTDASYPATISSFRLDKYEVTVGRFREFAAAWNDGYRPAVGAGKHVHLNSGAGLAATGGGNEPGWDPAWASNVDTGDTARGTTNATWTSSAGAYESRPINYVNWFEATAFCIWDGGFLPSEAEWEYAAAGGSDERTYPWGEMAPTCSFANFYYNNALCEAVAPSSAHVGKRSPTGDGRWGQSDLAGNLREWALDWYASPFTVDCINCTHLTMPVNTNRVLRGGNWSFSAIHLPAAHRYSGGQAARADSIGFRCARTP